MKGGALLWTAVIGGGALALLALGDDAEAATAKVVGAGAPPPPPGPPPTGYERVADDASPALYLNDDVEALARILTSEAGSHTAEERIAVGWVARNRARRKRISIAKMVCQPCGPSAGRGFSTRLPAKRKNRELAALILATPIAEDPTGGATGGFEPGLQDRLYRSGRKGYVYDARGIRRKCTQAMDYYGTIGRWDLFARRAGRAPGRCRRSGAWTSPSRRERRHHGQHGRDDPDCPRGVGSRRGRRDAPARGDHP